MLPASCWCLMSAASAGSSSPPPLLSVLFLISSPRGVIQTFSASHRQWQLLWEFSQSISFVNCQRSFQDLKDGLCINWLCDNTHKHTGHKSATTKSIQRLNQILKLFISLPFSFCWFIFCLFSHLLSLFVFSLQIPLSSVFHYHIQRLFQVLLCHSGGTKRKIVFASRSAENHRQATPGLRVHIQIHNEGHETSDCLFCGSVILTRSYFEYNLIIVATTQQHLARHGPD